MPNFGPIIEAATKGVRALTKPAIGEAGVRTADALLKEGAALGPSFIQRHQGIPFAGDPTMQAGLRATAVVQPTESTLAKVVQDGAMAIRGFVEPDPGMPKDIARKLIDHRQQEAHAATLATQTLRPIYAELKRDPVTQAATLWDYAVAADDAAQAARDGYDHILKVADDGSTVKIPIDLWLKGTGMIKSAVDADPEISAALSKRSAMWKDVFQDMVNEGAIIPERELKDYTPMRHLTGIARGLATASGDESLIRKLSAVNRRDASGGLRETNLALLEHDVLTRYFKWKTQRSLFNKLMADPSLNLTSKFKWGDPLPHNLVRYDPKPGQVGYMPATPEEGVFAGIADGLKMNKYASGGFVIPKALKVAFENISPHDAAAEDYWRRGGRAVARWLTVYNPKNLFLNMGSDMMTALMGLPGEKAQPLGVIRWAGALAGERVKRGLTGKSNTPLVMKIGGHMVDVSRLVEDAGLEQHTYNAQVSDTGQRMPEELARLLPPGAVAPAAPNPVAGFMQDTRQTVELWPRIAAGLEALERTGSVEEFGRVGRQITLEYGAGAPLATREPMWKAVAPFIQYAGLALKRVTELATTEGSRTRTLAAIVGIPLAAFMWNTRNEAFQKVEDALPSFERTQSHLIIPDFSNPEEPLRDMTGKPVVVRFRYMVTEEMAKQAGLGNMASRVDRVVRQKDTPMQLAASVGSSAASNMGSMLTMPGLALDMLSETDRFGKHRSIGEKIVRAVPALKIAAETAAGAQVSPQQGARRLAEESLGLSFASVARRGSTVMDAGLLERKGALMDAKIALKKAARSNDKVSLADAQKKLRQAADELKRYAKTLPPTGEMGAEDER